MIKTNSTRLRGSKKDKKTKKNGGASLFKEYISPPNPFIPASFNVQSQRVLICLFCATLHYYYLKSGLRQWVNNNGEVWKAQDDCISVSVSMLSHSRFYILFQGFWPLKIPICHNFPQILPNVCLGNILHPYPGDDALLFILKLLWFFKTKGSKLPHPRTWGYFSEMPCTLTRIVLKPCSLVAEEC